MKVLHVTAYFAPAFCYGGPPRSILNLCQALQAYAHDIHSFVLTTNANGDEEVDKEIVHAGEYEGIEVTYLARCFPKSLFHARGMRYYLNQVLPEIDVVHIHGCWNMFVWQAAYQCRVNNIPYIISPRGMLEPEAMKVSAWKKKALWPLERQNLRASSMLHATSDKEAATLSGLNLGVPIATVPNGVAVNEADIYQIGKIRARLNLVGDEVILLSVGRIHPIKGIEIMCDAIHMASVRHKVRLLVVGDGEANYVQQLKKRYHSLIQSGRLEFVGGGLWP